MGLWSHTTQPPGTWHGPGTLAPVNSGPFPSLAPADRMSVPLSWPVPLCWGGLQFHNAVIAGDPWEQKHRVSFMRFRHSQNERCLANSILDIPYLVFLSVNMLYRYID